MPQEYIDPDDQVLHQNNSNNEEYGSLKRKKVRKFFTR